MLSQWSSEPSWAPVPGVLLLIVSVLGLLFCRVIGAGTAPRSGERTRCARYRHCAAHCQLHDHQKENAQGFKNTRKQGSRRQH
eukprot:5227959-Pyramimonas_sp.AAC.1